MYGVKVAENAGVESPEGESMFAIQIDSAAGPCAPGLLHLLEIVEITRNFRPEPHTGVRPAWHRIQDSPRRIHHDELRGPLDRLTIGTQLRIDPDLEDCD